VTHLAWRLSHVGLDSGPLEPLQHPQGMSVSGCRLPVARDPIATMLHTYRN
jgi:hypothetical protein